MEEFSKHRLKRLNSGENTQTLSASLFDSMRKNKTSMFLELLSLAKDLGDYPALLRHSHEGETLLHAAVKVRAPSDVVSALMNVCPELLLESRQKSETYRGQTALHIAVTEGNLHTVDTLLRRADTIGRQQKGSLMHRHATGSRFRNTVMLGELPLTVAALSLNTQMVDLLLKHNAELDRQNSYGDTVCHSLIRYAHLYPEKVLEIVKMCEHITSFYNLSDDYTSHDIGTLCSAKDGHRLVHVWLLDNSDGYNPLRLAASLGLPEIFSYLMSLHGVYCYHNSDDGLFDVQMYDVSEIDAVPMTKTSRVSPIAQVADGTTAEISTPTQTSRLPQQPQRTPILELIFNGDPVTVFKFIELSPLRYVIGRKWPHYRWFYLLWAILHVLFMIGYTAYALDRSELENKYINTSESVYQHQRNKIGEAVFVTVYTCLSLLIAALYLLQELVRFMTGRMPWTLSHIMNCYHNGPFRIVLIVFSLCVIFDVVWAMLDENYEYYLLVCAMILGWWFIVFFLRGVKQFSFFTVMIQKVLVGDMFRFSIIIGMELVAFTTAMRIAFRGSRTLDDSVEDYGKLMVFMFKMMFGFTSIDVLFDARRAWFAVGIYTAFVLLTYVLMVNSLIAMMSNTCSVVSQNRDMQYRVQQLSIVLFFESVFPSCCMHYVGTPRYSEWYDTQLRNYVKKYRYFMEVRSLHEVTKSKSRMNVKPDTMLASIFHKLSYVRLPGAQWFADANIVEKEDKGTAIDDLEEDMADNELHQPVTCNSRATENTSSINPDEVGTTQKRKKRKHRKRNKTLWSEDRRDSVILSTSTPVSVWPDGQGRGRDGRGMSAPGGDGRVCQLRDEGPATLEIHHHPAACTDYLAS